NQDRDDHRSSRRPSRETRDPPPEIEQESPWAYVRRVDHLQDQEQRDDAHDEGDQPQDQEQDAVEYIDRIHRPHLIPPIALALSQRFTIRSLMPLAAPGCPWMPLVALQAIYSARARRQAGGRQFTALLMRLEHPYRADRRW